MGRMDFVSYRIFSSDVTSSTQIYSPGYPATVRLSKAILRRLSTSHYAILACGYGCESLTVAISRTYAGCLKCMEGSNPFESMRRGWLDNSLRCNLVWFVQNLKPELWREKLRTRV